MNILKRMLFMLFVFILSIGTCRAANTEYFKQGDLIKGVYTTRETRGVLRFDQANFIIRSSDHHVAYPLDFYAKFNSSKEYTIHDKNQAQVLNTTQGNWERIEAYNYFGYLYQGHEDMLWYAVTTKAILQSLVSASTFIITPVLRGECIPKTNTMLNELNKLVNNYLGDNIPSDIDLDYGETKKIVLDELSNYTLKGDYDNVVLAGNTLTIKGTTFGGEKILLERDGNTENVYTTNEYTKLMLLTDKLPKTTKEIDLYVAGGNLNLKFKNDENHDEICFTQDKNIYGLYTTDNTLINTLDVDNSQDFKLEDIAYGNYYVKQISHACNVKEDLNKYEININKKETTKTISLQDNYKKLLINKKICNGLKCLNEHDAEFTITGNNNEYKVKTNQLGNAYYNLTSGIYTIHQTWGMNNYLFSKDVIINLADYSSDRVTLNLTSEIKKGIVNVIITDEKGNLIRDAKVGLYSGSKEINCLMTNEYGKVVFDNVSYGSYSVKELNINDDYVLDKTKYNIELDSEENANIKIVNKSNKKDVNDTLNSKKESINNDTLNEADEDNDLSIDEVPETSVFENNYCLIIAIIVLLVLCISYHSCKAR